MVLCNIVQHWVRLIYFHTLQLNATQYIHLEKTWEITLLSEFFWETGFFSENLKFRCSIFSNFDCTTEKMQSRFFCLRGRFLITFYASGNCFLKREPSSIEGYVTPPCSKVLRSVRKLRNFREFETFSQKNLRIFRQFKAVSQKTVWLFQTVSQSAAPWRRSSLQVSTVGEAEQAFLSPAYSSASGSGWEAYMPMKHICQWNMMHIYPSSRRHVRWILLLSRMTLASGITHNSPPCRSTSERLVLPSDSCTRNIDINFKRW